MDAAESWQKHSVELYSDFNEIKESLAELRENVKYLKTQLHGNQSGVESLLKSVELLTKKLEMKDKIIENLEQKINELEQYQKKDNLIVAGPNLNLHTYSHVAGERAADSAEIERENLPKHEESIMKQNFIKFVEDKLHVNISESEILAIHKLHKRKDGTEPVLVRFVRNSTKRSVMAVRRRLKGTRIFINDHLTENNMGIDKKARQMRRDGKIHSNWTINGRIFIKETETGPKREKRNVKELE